MKPNTAKATDPIWDSRNSDEPEVPVPPPAPIGPMLTELLSILKSKGAPAIARFQAWLDGERKS